MDACIGHDRAGRNRIRILLHDPLDQHADCHRIYRPGAARPAAGILKDENADQPPSATNWIFGSTREVFDEVFDGSSLVLPGWPLTLPCIEGIGELYSVTLHYL